MLRIGFDMDGVLADMESELVVQAKRLFGEGILSDPVAGARENNRAAAEPVRPADESGESPADTPPLVRLRLTPRQERRLWQHVETLENFWEGLREIEPGSIGRLHALAMRRRWEIIFLTRRPQTAGATAQLQTQRWLEAKGYRLPSVYVVQGSRGRIAAALALDFVVDDRPENCLDVAIDSKARPILVWRDSENKLPAAARRLGIGVVSSVAQCLDVLAEVDASEPRAGMFDRFMRLLGLKEAAS
jgi:hypothetical protein